jgi:CheY-like chemotaxis protein
MSPERAARPRVLVVDDNRDAADSLVLLLTVWGYDAVAAYGGREALEAACALLPDCLVSDLNMPGVDGYHLAEALRGRVGLLVAVSGCGDEPRAKAAGFDRLLKKPADPMVIRSLVQTLGRE